MIFRFLVRRGLFAHSPFYHHPRKPDEGFEAVVEPSRGVESPKCGIVSMGWGVVRIAFF